MSKHIRKSPKVTEGGGGSGRKEGKVKNEREGERFIPCKLPYKTLSRKQDSVNIAYKSILVFSRQ